MHLKRLNALFVATLIFMTGPVSAAFASGIDKTKDELNQVENEKKDTKKRIEEIKALKDITMRDIDAIDVELYEIAQEINLIEDELDRTEILLVKTEEELKEAEEKRDTQYEVFKQRARYMYINGKVSYLDVIFSAESFSDLLKRFDYVNRIVQYDTEIVQMLQDAEDAVALKVDETQKQKSDLEILQYEQTQRQHSMEEIRVAKEAKIVELSNDEFKEAQVLSDLEKSSEELTKQIQAYMAEQERLAASQQRPIVYDYSGAQLNWPVPGYGSVSSGYVNRVNPISGKKEFHTGIDIPAKYGTSIVAAEAGTVITSSWVSGYGYTIIIDHGNGMTTLYGHNSSLVANKGDYVQRGQVVAKCGSTGYSTGNHCHFEVRIYGTPTNPNPYVGR